jgi:hypothetical protein
MLALLGAEPKGIEPLAVPASLGAMPKGIELLLALLGVRPGGIGPTDRKPYTTSAKAM